MNAARNKTLLALSMCASVLLPASFAAAQNYPTKSIRFLSPGSPGTTSDLIPRLLGDVMGKRMGVTFAVDNRPGGNGLLSANAMLAQAADGHTILLTTMGTLAMNPHVLPSMPFDVATAVTPVALAATMPLVHLVNPAKKITNLNEFVAWAKANPNFTFGSAGDASSGTIAMRVIIARNNLTGTHVAFRGFGPGIEAVAKGEIDTMLPDVGSALGMLSGGKLSAIAVTTRQRTPVLPDVPTYREQGFDFDIELWFGIFVKAGTAPDILKRLTDEVRFALSQPDIQAKWKTMGLAPGDSFGPDFVKYYNDDLARWAKVLPPMGLKQKE